MLSSCCILCDTPPFPLGPMSPGSPRTVSGPGGGPICATSEFAGGGRDRVFGAVGGGDPRGEGGYAWRGEKDT